MSVLLKIADAVVARLNSGSFELPFAAQRRYQPAFELAELATLRVSVIPRSIEVTGASRADSYFDFAVDVGVQQKVNADDPDQLDRLMHLVEQLADYLRHERLPDAAEAAWVSIANEPAFATEHLDQQRVFTSVLTVTYRVRR